MSFLRFSSLINTQIKSLHTTPSVHLIQKWRQERGLPLNPNADGVLTNGADYTYLDGRLTPLGSGQRERRIKERQSMQKIMQLTYEVDFAVKRHEQMKLDEQNRRKSILEGKLMAKGENLLKYSKK